MPFKDRKELPDPVKKNLNAAGQEAWRKTWNGVYYGCVRYGHESSAKRCETKAFAVAWAKVKAPHCKALSTNTTCMKAKNASYRARKAARTRATKSGAKTPRRAR